MTALLLLLALGFAACGEVSYTDTPPGYDGVTNRCTGGADCPDGFLCDTAHRMCVSARGVENRQLYIRVIPKGGDPEVFTVSFDSSGKRTVRYASKKTVSLPVLTLDEGLAVASRVAVADLNTVPGRAAELLRVDVAENGDAALADLPLFPGDARYRIEVTPRDRTFSPPTVYDDVSLDWDGDSEEAVLIDADGEPITALVLDDVNLSGAPGRVLLGTQPTPGLAVEVVDPKTGRSFSTRGTTGCPADTEPGAVCGDFTIYRFPEPEPFHLKIWKPEDPAYPAYIVASTSAEKLEDNVTVFKLPSLSGPVRFGARVERPRILASEEVVHDGLSDCLVVLKTEVSEGEPTIFLNAKTDSAGYIIGLRDDPLLHLYPAYYQISILPPYVSPESVEDYAPLFDGRRIDGSGSAVNNQVFLLEYRYRATVRVTAKGKPVPGATIEAVSLFDETPPTHSVGDYFGNHRIWLNAGAYRLTVSVPEESGFPFVVREIVVEKSGDTTKKPQEIVLDDIEIGLPAAASVKVSSDEVSLAGATVEWYEKWSDAAVIQVGRSTVDASGNTVGLLPAR